jgi:DNA helicase-2/ATP-dependent DNA helicase PcrA
MILSGGMHSLLIQYERELNPQQLAVVKAPAGPILVIAGAGSGKTRVVTYRVAHLIESGVNPANILLVTFTNKAAREMLYRVQMLIPATGGLGGKVWGGTFHHIGNRILRRHAPLVGFQPNYTILDRDDVKSLIDSCLADLKIHPRRAQFPRGEVLEDLAGLSVNTDRRIEELVAERYPFFLSLLDDILGVIARYREKKREANAMDFDDLLFYWKKLLLEHPDLRLRYGEQFHHILVDEYQDTNRIQAEIVDLLAQRHGNIMVVGDDSQSIYSFRGANFANILSFPERYPATQVFKLEINYRSTPQILHLANLSIANNRNQFPKVLQTVRAEGSVPSLVPLGDVMDQASFIAGKVEELHRQGKPLSEVAILYRAHYHSMELQMELTRRGIPFEVRSGLRFFEQAHIKDVSAFLKVVCNPLDELAWKRVLQLYPRVGKATAEKIWQAVRAAGSTPWNFPGNRGLEKNIPAGARQSWKQLRGTLKNLSDPALLADPGRMIEVVLQEGYESFLQAKYPNYESRTDDLGQLAAFAGQYGSCQDFLSELALLASFEGETGSVRGREEGTVTLSSVHQAKGLEWSVVFLVWLVEGRFPSQRSLAESGGEGEEEERRLFYVAVTRARDELFLCYPRFASDRGGRTMIQHASRFVSELCGEGLEEIETEEW